MIGGNFLDCKQFFEQIKGKRIAIFTHGYAICFFLMTWCKFEYDKENDNLIFKYKDKDFNELKTILLEKYQEIVTNITSGKIAPNPTENTCGYCPYYGICRYHGETRKISKKGKVKADATVE